MNLIIELIAPFLGLKDLLQLRVARRDLRDLVKLEFIKEEREWKTDEGFVYYNMLRVRFLKYDFKVSITNKPHFRLFLIDWRHQDIFCPAYTKITATTYINLVPGGEYF